MTSIRLSHEDYTVGWVCALEKEQTAARVILDSQHPRLPARGNDENSYILGSIGGHNIVIACLPMGQPGNSSASNVATSMIRSFPAIKFGLMVGIGGGIPTKVKLGDVVVGVPGDAHPGIVQWDLGKTDKGGNFKPTGSLNNAPKILLTSLSTLLTNNNIFGSKIPDFLTEVATRYPNLDSAYTSTKSLEDVVFPDHVPHRNRPVDSTGKGMPPDGIGLDEDCRFCDRTNARTNTIGKTTVHRGLILSGDQVIKDAELRNKICARYNWQVLCIEMEAAGILNAFPCLVIRGICDYADPHKNKAWQEYAATVAAGFAKELLLEVPQQEILEMPSIMPKVLEIESQMNGMREEMNEVSIFLGEQRNHRRSKEHQAILTWLNRADYGNQQSDFLARREEGTGEWLLSSQEFHTWLETEKRTMFCTGDPGAGKTILTSVIVQHLSHRFRDLSTGIVVVYCDQTRRKEQGREHFLSSILKQLAQQSPSLPETVISLREQHRKNRTRPIAPELIVAISAVANTYSRVFIIIDGLDECEIGCRAKLLPDLFKLQTEGPIKLLATARAIPNIEEWFKESIHVTVRAKDQDVQKYIEGRQNELPSWVRKDEGLKQEILENVKSAAGGLFLLAQLHIDSLRGVPSKKALRKALKDLETGIDAYDHSYKQAMIRIRDQAYLEVNVATKALLWLACAERPLSTSELQVALGVELEESKLDQDNITPIDHIVSVCAGLVTVDEHSHVIRLMHHTTRDYLSRTQDQWFLEPSSKITAQDQITDICATYLTFSEFDKTFCSTDEEYETRLQSNPLYVYATQNWGHHARQASRFTPRLMLFLTNSYLVEASSQAVWADPVDGEGLEYSQAFPKVNTGLHLAAYFGVKAAASALIEQGAKPDVTNSYQETPLWLAAFHGHEPVVGLLLATGRVDINKTNTGRYTPLQIAAMGGHESTFKIQNAADPAISRVQVDLVAECGRTAFSWAAGEGHQDIVRRLITTKVVDINSKDTHYGRVPLSWAAENGHIPVVKLLLNTGIAEVDSKDSECGRTPLSRAAEKGHAEIVKLLIDTGKVDINSQSIAKRTLMPEFDSVEGGRTPLSWAAEKGHIRVVALLLGTFRADVNLKSDSGRTARSWALKEGHHLVAELLSRGN